MYHNYKNIFKNDTRY